MKYFDGHEVLFPEVAEEFSDALDKAELLADIYNTDLVLRAKPSGASGSRRKPKGLIDLADVEARGKEMSATLAAYMVDMAKAEALDAMGDNRAAVAVVERHIWRSAGISVQTL